MTINQNSFASRISNGIRRHSTSLCVGIDPDIENSPIFAREWISHHGGPSYLEHFSRNLIEASVGSVAAVKFQSAFFEAFGSEGFNVLRQMIALANSKGLITILDAKRGDISSTMRAYGEMAFNVMRADALTVTPYMGTDTVSPLLPWLQHGHGVYLVWITSNQGGALVQDSTIGQAGLKMSTKIFNTFNTFFEQHDVRDAYGWVVGATRISAIDPSIRPALKHAPTLMPGVGAQGGAITADLKSILTGNHALLPQSRGLSKGPDSLRSWDDLFTFSREKILCAAQEASI